MIPRRSYFKIPRSLRADKLFFWSHCVSQNIDFKSLSIFGKGSRRSRRFFTKDSNFLFIFREYTSTG